MSSEAAPPGAARAWTARVPDLAFALTALSACVLGLSDPRLPFAPRLTAAALSATVAVLFLRRAPATRGPRSSDVLSALPSVLMAGIVQRLSAPTWSPIHQGLFALFGVATVLSLVALGESFSVFPARRVLVVRGPYAYVRHPIYLAELAMFVTAAATDGPLTALACLSAMLVLLIPRIQREEHALAADPDHALYAARVRFRLVPGLY